MHINIQTYLIKLIYLNMLANISQKLGKFYAKISQKLANIRQKKEYACIFDHTNFNKHKHHH